MCMESSIALVTDCRPSLRETQKSFQSESLLFSCNEIAIQRQQLPVRPAGFNCLWSIPRVLHDDKVYALCTTCNLRF